MRIWRRPVTRLFVAPLSTTLTTPLYYRHSLPLSLSRYTLWLHLWKCNITISQIYYGTSASFCGTCED